MVVVDVKEPGHGRGATSSPHPDSNTSTLALTFSRVNFHVFCVIAGLAKRMAETTSSVQATIAKLDLKSLAKTMSHSKVNYWPCFCLWHGLSMRIRKDQPNNRLFCVVANVLHALLSDIIGLGMRII